VGQYSLAGLKRKIGVTPQKGILLLVIPKRRTEFLRQENKKFGKKYTQK
jgi:hypothetical protein